MSTIRTMGMALVTCLIFLLPNTAAAKNVALIIGNSDYDNVANLPNPVNDASLAVSTFSALGFQTFVTVNASAAAMHEALDAFRQNSANADVAAIVFAGHGVQADNVNYLVARDTDAETAAAFQQTSVRMEDFVGAFSDSANVRFLIVDACRDNPFAQTRSLTSFIDSKTRGLSRVNQKADNLLVLYSAQPNERALDGEGDHSPFMEAVSTVLLSNPKVKLSEALIDITNLVRTNTGNKQIPYTEGSLSAHIELKLNFVMEKAEAEAKMCEGTSETIPFKKLDQDSATLSPVTHKLLVTDDGDLNIEVCSDGKSVHVNGPFEAQYTREALQNVADEGVGYYFETSDGQPAYLWFYVDANTPGAPVEIGYYLNEQEINWVETHWVLE